MTCRAVCFINNSNGTFTRKALPTEAQLSPMYGIAADDFDKDGKHRYIDGRELLPSQNPK